MSEASSGGRPLRCDDAGHCSCIRIASIGHEGVWGPCSTSTKGGLQTWLNAQSSAAVDTYDVTKPTLTPEFLAQYDVILLQWLVSVGAQVNDGAPWAFSADEITALQNWVNAGGGVIALSGYQCSGNGCTIYDTTTVNQLLAFADIQFNSDDVLDPSQAGANDFYCWGGAIPLGAQVTASDPYVSCNWSSPIGAHVTDIGAFMGRSIKTTSAAVDCTDGKSDYVVHQQVGNGHVVAYGDEWATYAELWANSVSCVATDNDSGYSPCYQKSPEQVFQIPQFWYNAIKYASGAACFQIASPQIVP
jgi:hypothetical protein